MINTETKLFPCPVEETVMHPVCPIEKLCRDCDNRLSESHRLSEPQGVGGVAKAWFCVDGDSILCVAVDDENLARRMEGKRVRITLIDETTKQNEKDTP